MKVRIEGIEIPSVNHCWKKGRNGVTYLTRRGKEFKKTLSLYAIAAGFKPLKCDVKVKFIWHCRRGGRGDLDNKCKCILDALNNIAYKDDRQVTEINAIKQRYAGFDGLTVEVEKL